MKMRPVKTIPGMGGGRIKENDGGGRIQIWSIVRSFIKVHNVPPVQQ
jgi:hypothetical protein